MSFTVSYSCPEFAVIAADRRSCALGPDGAVTHAVDGPGKLVRLANGWAAVQGRSRPGTDFPAVVRERLAGCHVETTRHAMEAIARAASASSLDPTATDVHVAAVSGGRPWATAGTFTDPPQWWPPSWPIGGSSCTPAGMTSADEALLVSKIQGSLKRGGLSLAAVVRRLGRLYAFAQARAQSVSEIFDVGAVFADGAGFSFETRPGELAGLKDAEIEERYFTEEAVR